MTDENVCPHCGEARETPHVLVLEDDPYCDECWEKLIEDTAKDYDARYEAAQ